ncbi:MAG: hypothetical protein ACOCR0_02445, partial [Haloferacaceae archaeon]
MTLAFLKSDGSGPLDYELVIEGWPDTFGTAGLETGTLSDDRERIGGLNRAGLGFSEKAQPVRGGLPKIDAFTADLGDEDSFERVSRSLIGEPSLVTYLTESVDDVETTWTLMSTAGIAAGDHLHVATETVRVDSVVDDTTIEVTRNRWGTHGQSHTVLHGDDTVYPEVTDRPVVISGRAAALYAYGPTETDLSSWTGSAAPRLIGASSKAAWKGIVGSRPILQRDMVGWALQLSPQTRRLKQEIGEGFDEAFSIIGVYYDPKGWLGVVVHELTGTEWTDDVSKTVRAAYAGFSRDNAEFAEDFQAFLNSEVNPEIQGNVTVHAPSNDDWHVTYVPSSTDARYARVHVGSGVDGFTIGGSLYRRESDGSLAFAGAVTGGETYHLRWDDSVEFGWTVRGVPRACYQNPSPPGVLAIASGEAFDGVEYPDGARDVTVYLSRADLISEGDILLITHNYGLGASARETRGDTRELSLGDEKTRAHNVESVDPLTGKVTVEDVAFSLSSIWVRDNAESFRAAANLGLDSDLRQFIVSTRNEAKKSANIGVVPWITEEDVAAPNSSDMEELIDGMEFLGRRDYFFTEPTSYDEVLAAEAQLLRAIWTLDDVFRFRVVRMDPALPTDSDIVDLTDAEDRDIHDGFGELDVEPFDVANVVEITMRKAGLPDDLRYGAIEDPDDDSKIVWRIRQVNSISRYKQRKTVKIDPKSDTRFMLTSLREATKVADPLLSMFGRRYFVTRVPVTPRHLKVLVWDSVRVSVPQMPWFDPEKPA